MVTGMLARSASFTAPWIMAVNNSIFHGRADPPPLRVTLGTGQPKLSPDDRCDLLRPACVPLYAYRPGLPSTVAPSEGPRRHRGQLFAWTLGGVLQGHGPSPSRRHKALPHTRGTSAEKRCS